MLRNVEIPIVAAFGQSIRQLEVGTSNTTVRDAEVVARGNEAAHYGNALADATLCHPDNPIKRKDKTKYASMYQFNQDKILALRDCKQFIDMVSWHTSMRNWHHTYGIPKENSPKHDQQVPSQGTA